MGANLTKYLFIPDCHIPFEDKKAWGVMLRAAKLFEPNHVVVMGDFADMYEVSFHDKDPERQLGLRKELEAVGSRLGELLALEADHYDYILGNHEARLDRYLLTKAPAIYGTCPTYEQMVLGTGDWRVTPYKKTLRLGKLHLTHDRKDCGATAHIKARAKYAGNAVIGHTHHLGVDYVGNARGEQHVGAVFGWLGDRKKIDYMHEEDAAAWTLGFGIGYGTPDGTIHLQPVPIINYKCVIEGMLIT